MTSISIDNPTLWDKFNKKFAWLDSDYQTEGVKARLAELAKSKPRMEISRLAPFLFTHLGCLAVFWVGWSPVAVGLALAFFFFRIFSITAFYHRYFSHRAYKTSRIMQFLFAVSGLTAVQRGPLWWASNHRHHHRVSDQPTDLHSPVQSGFWWSHMGWMTCSTNMYTDYSRVPDLCKFPELVTLNRFDWFIPLVIFFGSFGLGALLENTMPELGTNGWQMLVWLFFISTTIVFQATCTINSLAHVFGTQRYEAGDTSRNNFWLALLTLGEGWHNNHHQYQGAARNGFFWWEIDITFYVLKVMQTLGLIWDLNPVPPQAYDRSTWKTQSQT
jgi:stearoyl-CoA desaturase (delta-9 desaturase)